MPLGLLEMLLFFGLVLGLAIYEWYSVRPTRPDSTKESARRETHPKR